MLRRRKWIIVQAVILVPVVAVVLSQQQEKVYAASSEVLLARSSLGSALLDIDDPFAFQDPSRFGETQAKLARSLPLARRVVASVPNAERSAGQLLASSQVFPEANADLLVFRVEDGVPEVAARMATAYAEEFIEFKQEFDTGRIRQAREGVQEQIRELRDEGADNDSAVLRSLLESRNDLQTLEALQSNSAILIQAPENANQVAPTPRRNGMLGLMLGLFLGVGFAFLAEALDRRVRTEQEVEEELDVPLLARLPAPPRDVRRKEGLVMLSKPSGVHAEAFRKLRTNIEFATLGRDITSIMVTSAAEREGKSTTVANLALALALAGKRVALVDLDLRQPALERMFSLRGSPGVTDVALGKVSLEEALVRVPLSNPRGVRGALALTNGGSADSSTGSLALLPAGSIPPDAGEFVASEALSGILATLERRSDVVLVDAPPVLVVGDALTLSARVDGLFVVARLSVLLRPMLVELGRVLERAPATKLGFVLADAEHGATYGYGDYYVPRPESERELAR